jgi:hypothetical protein
MTDGTQGTAPTTEIIPSAQGLPTATPRMQINLEEIQQWYDSFNRFKEKVLLSNSAFTAEINTRGGRKRLINRAGWRAVGLAFHLDDEIIREEKITHEDGKNFSIAITVRVYHAATGRTVQSVGSASSDEPGKGWLPTYHNVRSIAHTRAKNRGISDIVGSGEVSVEELLDHEDAQSVEPATIYQCPHCPASLRGDENTMLTHMGKAHAGKGGKPIAIKGGQK